MVFCNQLLLQKVNGAKMTTKNFIIVGLCIITSLCLSCSNNPLANTIWQDTSGTRTITFTESTFRWIRDDTGYDERGTYTVSKDAVFLIFNNPDVIDADGTQTGSFINGVLSFTAALEAHYVKNITRINVEFHRVR
jgi:hypothetical protein